MAEELVRLARDFELRRSMAAVGYTRAKRFYTYEQFISSYAHIYEQEYQIGKEGR